MVTLVRITLMANVYPRGRLCAEFWFASVIHNRLLQVLLLGLVILHYIIQLFYTGQMI